MPKSIKLPKGATYSGVQITWTPSASRLDISGWYDEYVGIEGDSMTLAEFFERLGVTEKDIQRALKK